MLSRNNDCYPSLATCVAPSNTVKASPQQKGFQVRSSSIPLNTLSKVLGFLNKVDLPSTLFNMKFLSSTL